MKTWLRLTILGTLVYLLALVALFPASLALDLGSRLAGQGGLRLAVEGISGTIWSGSAASAAVNGNLLGGVRWSLSPWRLFLGQAGVDLALQPEGGYLNANAVVGAQSLHLSGAEGSLSAAGIMRLLPRLPMPVELDGRFSLNLETLAWNAGRVEALAGTVIWNQAALIQPMPVKLGDLKAVLESTPEGKLIGKLSDGGGPLQISGQIEFNPDRSYRIDALLAARPGADPALSQGLAMLGTPDPKGRRRLQWNGRL